MFKFFKRNCSEFAPRMLSREEKRELKWKRMMLKKLRWGVIRRYEIIKNLQNATTLYDVKNLINHWNHTQNIISEIKDVQLSDSDMEVIRRFIRKEQYFNRCEYVCDIVMSLEDYNSKENLDIQKYLLNAYVNYQAYWDEVLGNYKRPAAKKKRLQELIEALDRDSHDPLTAFSEVRKKISDLRIEYCNMLNKLLS